jgi:hypothetical protein
LFRNVHRPSTRCFLFVRHSILLSDI